MKDMPSRLTITSFFQRKEQKPIINDGINSPEDTVLTDRVLSSEVCGTSKFKVIMNASNIENFLSCWVVMPEQDTVEGDAPPRKRAR